MAEDSIQLGVGFPTVVGAVKGPFAEYWMVQSSSWSLMAREESFLDHWHRADLDHKPICTNAHKQLHQNCTTLHILKYHTVHQYTLGHYNCTAYHYNCTATIHYSWTALHATTTALNCMPLKLHTTNFVERTGLGWLVMVISISAIVAFHQHLPLLHPVSFPCEGLSLLHSEIWTATIKIRSKVPLTN